MNNTFETFELKSSYKRLPIKIFFKKSPTRSKKLLIFHPGAFEKVWGDGNRYKKILLWLQKNLKDHPHIVSYQTSRREDVLEEQFKSKVEYWKKIFEGKVFGQELDDVKKVYKFILSHSFKRQQKLTIESVHALGFSLGGTFGMILTSYVPRLHKVCTIGSAISTKRAILPVLKGYPSKKWILERVGKYKHYLKMFQGFAEEVVPIKDIEEVFSAVKKAKNVSITRVERANHMFSGKNKFGLINSVEMLNDIRNFFNI